MEDPTQLHSHHMWLWWKILPLGQEGAQQETVKSGEGKVLEMVLKGSVSNNNNNKISKKQFGKVLPQVLEDAEKMQSADCPAWGCPAELLARRRGFHFIFCQQQGDGCGGEGIMESC